MGVTAISNWVISSMLLSLRIVPLFAFAPPFTLMRIPRFLRVLLCIGLAATIVASSYPDTINIDTSVQGLAIGAVRELLLGLTFALAFQIAFAALYLAGRTIDIQAGFGLALLIDPTSRSQTPLAGTLFAYAAAGIFFSMNGHNDLLRLIAASLEVVPLGAPNGPLNVAKLTSFMSVAFLIGFGVAGAAILTLFLADLAIAMMSRTMPQMNVLVLGFQVKALIFMIVLAGSFGSAGALMARLLSTTLSSMLDFADHG